MPTFTPVYLNAPTYKHNRGYVYGFAVVDVGAINVDLTDNILTYDNPPYHVHAVINEAYFNWNSGWWNVQGVWDVAECFVSVAGTPIDAGLFFSIEYTPDRQTLVQACRLFFPYGTFQIRPGPPPPSGYWLPQPEL